MSDLPVAKAEVKRLGKRIGNQSALTMPDWKYTNLRAEYSLALRRLRDAEDQQFHNLDNQSS